MSVFEQTFWKEFNRIGLEILDNKSLRQLEDILRYLDESPKFREYDTKRESDNSQTNDRIKEDFDDRYREIAGEYRRGTYGDVNIINGGDPSTRCCPILLVKIKGDSKLSEKLTRAGHHIKSCKGKTKAVVFVGTVNYFTWLKLRWMFSDCFVILKPIAFHNQILLPRL